VLEKHKIPLALLVPHLLLESGAEGIEGVAAGHDLLIREDTNPLQSTEKALFLLGVLEGGLGGDGPGEVFLGVGGGAEDLLCSL
jgi:hypothetical protein